MQTIVLDPTDFVYVTVELDAIYLVASVHTACSYSAIIFLQLSSAEQRQPNPCGKGWLRVMGHSVACSLTIDVIQEPACQVELADRLKDSVIRPPSAWPFAPKL